MRQDLTDAAGMMTMYWVTSYDTSGHAIQAINHDVSGTVLSTATYTYSGDLRTGSTIVDVQIADAPATYVVAFEYSEGTLASSTQRTGDVVLSTNKFVFDAGRKMTTFRYDPNSTLLSRTEFAYDSGNSRRSGATSYDASNNPIGSSLRTYEGDSFTEARVESLGMVQHRKFTFEDGPCAVDPEIFFEF